jgi:hypothetical protein
MVALANLSGVPNPGVIAPEGYALDAAIIARPGKMDIQCPRQSSSTQAAREVPRGSRRRQAHSAADAKWGRFFIPSKFFTALVYQKGFRVLGSFAPPQ